MAKRRKPTKIEQAYRKERKRVTNFVSRMRRAGYDVPREIVPEIPGKITKAAIEQLKKLTPDVLRLERIRLIEEGYKPYTPPAKRRPTPPFNDRVLLNLEDMLNRAEDPEGSDWRQQIIDRHRAILHRAFYGVMMLEGRDEVAHRVDKYAQTVTQAFDRVIYSDSKDSDFQADMSLILDVIKRGRVTFSESAELTEYAEEFNET